jgi:hypothetical protein
MIGRCGRDGKAGLAVMFVEKTRRGGKNWIDQFVRGEPQNDLDCMDAMAISPLCLRVAFAMDNLWVLLFTWSSFSHHIPLLIVVYFGSNRDGYVPLWADDPKYLQEVAQEEKAGMCFCQFSNCAPQKADRLLELLVHANLSNFDSILDDKFSTSVPYNLRHKYPQKKTSMRKRKFNESDDQEISDFLDRLVGHLRQHYDSHIAPNGTILASHIFGEEDSKAILAVIDSIYSAKDLRGVIGGDCFPGKWDWIYQWLCDFKSLGTMQQSSSVPPPKKIRTPITNQPKRSTITQQKLGHGVAPRAPTKKAVAAEAARIRSIERKKAKEKRDADNEKRRQQVIQIMAETQGLHDLQ